MEAPGQLPSLPIPKSDAGSVRSIHNLCHSRLHLHCGDLYNCSSVYKRYLQYVNC